MRLDGLVISGLLEFIMDMCKCLLILLRYALAGPLPNVCLLRDNFISHWLVVFIFVVLIG